VFVLHRITTPRYGCNKAQSSLLHCTTRKRLCKDNVPTHYQKNKLAYLRNNVTHHCVDQLSHCIYTYPSHASQTLSHHKHPPIVNKTHHTTSTHTTFGYHQPCNSNTSFSRPQLQCSDLSPTHLPQPIPPISRNHGFISTSPHPFLPSFLLPQPLLFHPNQNLTLTNPNPHSSARQQLNPTLQPLSPYPHPT
jgi:hypothetical protein